MTDTGFKSLFFCCQIIGAIMRENGYGKIINLSSTFSRSIVPNRAVYAAIKAGISHLTEALALEWAAPWDKSQCPCTHRRPYAQSGRHLKRRLFEKDPCPYPIGSAGHARRPYGCGHLPFQPCVRLCHRSYPVHRWRLGSR